MSFYPSKGTITTNNFNSTEGAIFTSPSLQGILGGYVTLLSTATGYSVLDRNWSIVPNWNLENNLVSLDSLTGQFNLYTGNITSPLVNTVSGFIGIEASTTALTITTDYPAHYSGRGVYGISLNSGSPNKDFSIYVTGHAGEKLTLHFDVMCTSSYTGHVLSGFSSSQNNITGLAPLSGVVGHGVFIGMGNLWDFIEISPFGLRSYNHPDITLPLNLNAPKRVRIGIDNGTLYLASEEGSSVIGYNKFDTISSNTNISTIFIGAPSNDLAILSGVGGLNGITASVGSSMWDNIKVLHDLSIYQEDIVDRTYSTGFVTMYTSEFNPDMAIDKFLNAKIDYLPYKGGATVVTAQYSGETGWINSNSVSLDGQSYSANLDLSTIPIYNYPRTDGGKDLLSNPIRFRIDQRSFSGDSLPPAVDSIELLIDKERYQIDLIPDWKPSNSTVVVKVGLDTGTFSLEDPIADLWTNFLMNTPSTTGVITQTGFYESSNSLPIIINGTGEIFRDGPYQYCIQNYVNTELTAQSGSDAYNFFGTKAVKNIYPNPFFALPFRQIINTERNYITGLVNGQLSEYVYIPDKYTGTFKVDYLQESVFRPENQARANRIKQNLGQQSMSNEEYVQSVYVYPSAQVHQGRVGLQLEVPSGIATGQLDVTFDLLLEKGKGLSVIVSGSNTKEYYVPGEYYRSFTPVSIKTDTTSSNLNVSLYIPSGYTAEEYKFSVDNFTVSPYISSYIKSTGIFLDSHTLGTSEDTGLFASTNNSVAISSSIYLDSYPETKGTLIRLSDSAASGFVIDIDNRGYLSGYMTLISDSLDSYGNIIHTVHVKSKTPFPLGSWTNFAVYQDNHYYSGLSSLATAGDPNSINAASTNKLWLGINGQVVGGSDSCPLDWTGTINSIGQISPTNSRMYNAGLPITCTLMSGVYGRIDAVKIISNPTSEAEVEIAIKNNRLPPYYVPDVLFKTGPDSIFESGIIKDNKAGKDLHIGSYYNFSSPGYPGWDRGILRNHLIFSGSYAKELNAPYGKDLYSTRLLTGTLAIAEYSSSYNFINTSNEELGLSLTVDSDSKYCSGCNDNSFALLGWIYPRATGVFFSYENDSNLNRLELNINSDYKLISNKYNNSNSLQYSHTGHQLNTGEWNYFFVNLIHTGVKSLTATGVTTSYIGNTSGYSSHVVTGTQGYVLYNTGSRFKFIGTDQSLFNIAIPHIYNKQPTTGEYWTTGNKGGRYQVVIENSSPVTGEQIFDTYTEGYFTLGPTTGNSNRYFSLAYHNTYDNIPRLQGIAAYDNTPFKEVSTYSILYDTEQVDRLFGRTDSPIRLGNKVPDNAINLARYSSPSHTVPSSISTIDLSDKNVNNLINYKEGEYLIGGGTFSGTLISGTNSGLYSGMYDVRVSGQIVSSDVNITNCIISDLEMEEGEPAYYYYLVGRGNKYVQIPGAYPHYTGQLNSYATGTIPEMYIANLERIKQSIYIKNRKGEAINKEVYPYDISISPYATNILDTIIKNSTSIYIDNQNTVSTGSLLPDGVFSVVLLLNKNRIEGESLFLHYTCYDSSTKEIIPGYKEIINPMPIFRERHYSESPKIGLYDISLNTNSYFDLCLYGINSGYSGSI